MGIHAEMVATLDQGRGERFEGDPVVSCFLHRLFHYRRLLLCG